MIALLGLSPWVIGLAVAIASGLTNRPVGPDVVCVGELGLAGELRSVAQIDRRLQESFRLGFRRAIVPSSAQKRTGRMSMAIMVTRGKV